MFLIHLDYLNLKEDLARLQILSNKLKLKIEIKKLNLFKPHFYHKIIFFVNIDDDSTNFLPLVKSR